MATTREREADRAREPHVTGSLLDLVGRTPLLALRRIGEPGAARIWAKLEFLNPSGSVKDRIALAMIEAAEAAGHLQPGGTVVEPTSGNTGIALATVCAIKGYRMIAVLPAAMSPERVRILRALGACVDVVPAQRAGGAAGEFALEDLEATLARARELAATIPGAFMPNQFENAANPAAHGESTAREILAQAGPAMAAFVAAVGTGGTLVGVAEVLRREAPGTHIVAVEPATSAVISGEAPGFHRQQGVGEGFVPKVFRREAVDEVLTVSDDEAVAMARRLAREEAILGGFSSGSNVAAALRVARRFGPERAVVTLVPDSGLRYLSTDLYQGPDIA
jgi:cysteine synthase